MTEKFKGKRSPLRARQRHPSEEDVSRMSEMLSADPGGFNKGSSVGGDSSKAMTPGTASSLGSVMGMPKLPGPGDVQRNPGNEHHFSDIMPPEVPKPAPVQLRRATEKFKGKRSPLRARQAMAKHGGKR